MCLSSPFAGPGVRGLQEGVFGGVVAFRGPPTFLHRLARREGADKLTVACAFFSAILPGRIADAEPARSVLRGLCHAAREMGGQCSPTAVPSDTFEEVRELGQGG